MIALRHLVSPLLAELRGGLQACGQVRLAVHFDGGGAQEMERAFLLPTSAEGRIVQALEGLLDRLVQSSRLDQSLGIAALAVTLEQIQDAVPKQLTLFPDQECRGKLQEVERYLAARFGAPPFGGGHLRRAVLDQPGAPLPEWRVSWQSGSDL